jgi:glycosyltransferase XagB
VPADFAQLETALKERIVRVAAYMFIVAALVVVVTRSTADQRLTYIAIAAGLCLVVFVQELLPASLLGRWRLAVEISALLVFISVLVVLTGGYASLLFGGYLLLVAGASLWGDLKAPLMLGAASMLAYATAVLGPPALTGTVAPPEALARVGLAAAGLGIVSLAAALVSRAKRRPKPLAAPVAPPATESLPSVVVSGEAPWELSALAVTPPPNALEVSVRGLLRRTPEMSAFRTLSRSQLAFLLVIVAILAIGVVIAPLDTVIALNVVITAIYLLALAFNLAIFRALLRKPPMLTVSDEEASAVPDDQLPSYTVLVAAYHEGEIINSTIRALEGLDYPRHRLDILLLLEAGDDETIRAARAARPASHIRIVVVPDAAPKTKPKACNYGLQLSSGELVTIFDAEDRPDPLQLRRAAVAFSRMPPQIACLQARLQFHNEGQNVLTRWFSAEYVTWFAAVLPALVRLRAPVPLGGTSMHVRRDVLEAVGAWDPFKVTEDADLGIRLWRAGYRTLVLDSVTLEEANSDFINWVKQRSRWYKGYLQTWLVHMRQPRRLWRELGPAGFLGFQVLVGSTPLLALLNPLFWLLTALWFLSGAHIVQVLFPAFVFYPALVSVVFGNFLALYRTMVSVRLADHPGLVISALVLPIYWVFMSIAAMRAFLQLLVAPSFWEKTMHGLDQTVHAQSPP